MDRDLNVRLDTIKLLEENIGRTLFDINHSKIFFDPPPRIWTPRGGGDGGVLNWAIGIDTYTLMCIKLMTNKNLLCKKIKRKERLRS